MRKKLTAIALSLIVSCQSVFALGTNCNVFASETGNMAAISNSIKVGDLNCDNGVDSIDFALLKSYLLGIVKDFPVDDDLAVGDLNRDNSINAIDLGIMKMYLLGTIKELPLEENVQTLFINEVMSANTTTLRDGDVEDADAGSLGGAYSDWIEIYNSGAKDIDLTGYIISDSNSSWVFPSGVVPTKGHLLVWASDKNKVAKDGQLHAYFKLSASGETITLRTPYGRTVDTVIVGALKDDESFGRKTDASTEWVVFSKPTPSKENVYSSETVAVKEPVFTHNGGFYTSEFILLMTTEEADTKIYYTLNGSDPVPGTEGTFEYIDPILVKSRAGEPNVLSMISDITNDPWTEWQPPRGEVFKCTTIKAVAIRNGSNKSRIVTNSYFVDKDIMTRYNLPVISLVTDQANFFDEETGLYVNENYENTGKEWERPVHIEFFEKDGTLGFSQYSGLRINGGWSRKNVQKSFRLYADHGYDDNDNFEYEVFPGLKKKASGKKLDKFDTLILRNAGNDGTWTGTMFRDILTQGLVAHLNTDTTAYRQSVVFLDGEFWGIYNIRERYDSDYLKSHYSLDKDKVVMFDVYDTLEVLEGEKSDRPLYQDDVIKYLENNDITDPDVYNYIKTKIDIENYIIYNVTNIISGNTDWPGNNVTIWKYKTEDGNYHPEAPKGQDGRWRWLLRDTDFGFGFQNQSPAFDSIRYATTDDKLSGTIVDQNYTWAVFLLKTLIKNHEFRNQFINCFADQLNTSFDPTRVNARIDELKAVIETAMPEQSDRWRAINIVSEYEGDPIWYVNIKTVKDYADQRPSYIRQYVVNKFQSEGVTGTSEINIKTNPTEGYVKVNTTDIKATTPGITNPSDWTGLYFKGVPVTLKAVPNKGYEFDHWEGISGVSATSESITFNPDENVSITPVFKYVGD